MNAKALSLTPAQKDLAASVLRDVWNEIAADMFQTLAGENKQTSMPQGEVIEVVFDADRPAETLRRSAGRRLGSSPEDVKAVIEWFEDYGNGEHEILGKEVFPYKSYS